MPATATHAGASHARNPPPMQERAMPAPPTHVGAGHARDSHTCRSEPRPRQARIKATSVLPCGAKADFGPTLHGEVKIHASGRQVGQMPAAVDGKVVVGLVA